MSDDIFKVCMVNYIGSLLITGACALQMKDKSKAKSWLIVYVLLLIGLVVLDIIL